MIEKDIVIFLFIEYLYGIKNIAIGCPVAYIYYYSPAGVINIYVVIKEATNSYLYVNF